MNDYEEEDFEENDELEENDGLEEDEDSDDDGDFDDYEDSEEDEEDLEEDENLDDDEDSENYSWAEAVKSHSVFYGKRVIIALICRELVSNNGNGVTIRPIKWKIATKEGGKWKVVEELPLNCDIETIFSEYGLPIDFTPSEEYFCDEDDIEP